MSDLKETLLQDLCARLPYHTMVECKTDHSHKFDEELSIMHIMNFYQFDVKPYLRLLSDMTEDEKKEFNAFFCGKEPLRCDFSAYPIEYQTLYFFDAVSVIDWLNSHHFDYRGLIKKGLALKAKKEMYKK